MPMELTILCNHFISIHILYSDGDMSKTVLQYTAYTIWGLSGLYLIIVFCLYSSIRKALAVLKASAAFLSANFHTIIVPIMSILFSFAFIAAWIIAALYLFSVGDIVGETGGT